MLRFLLDWSGKYLQCVRTSTRRKGLHSIFFDATLIGGTKEKANFFSRTQTRSTNEREQCAEFERNRGWHRSRSSPMIWKVHLDEESALVHSKSRCSSQGCFNVNDCGDGLYWWCTYSACTTDSQPEFQHWCSRWSSGFALLEQLPKCQLLLFALAHHERHTRHGRLHALPSFAGTTYVVFIIIFLDRIRPFDSFKSDTESHKREYHFLLLSSCTVATVCITLCISRLLRTRE